MSDGSGKGARVAPGSAEGNGETGRALNIRAWPDRPVPAQDRRQPPYSAAPVEGGAWRARSFSAWAASARARRSTSYASYARTTS